MARRKKLTKQQSLIYLIIIILGYVFYYATSNMNQDVKKSDNSNNQIQLIKCIDGDTANFSELGKTRFLFVDTPESTKKIEPYGKEAAAFTCKKLKEAKVITYEYDGSKKDKYDRSLAWIFVDGVLLQEELAKNGYIKKYYDYGKYKYENLIRNSLNDKYHIFEEE